jgi:hypothetical protein
MAREKFYFEANGMCPDPGEIFANALALPKIMVTIDFYFLKQHHGIALSN